VTFNIPVDAAERLRQLAQHPNSVLRQLGVLAVQIGADNVMSLSVGGNGSATDSKPSDAIAGSCSQAICQSSTEVSSASTSVNVSGKNVDSSFPQFKVPSSIVPSCCANVLPPASGAMRTVAMEGPVRGVVPGFSVTQPRPLGLVRWPNIIAGRPGSDAVAVRFAVPSLPVKEFSQGLCFVSPLTAAVSQHGASSSPLLVNLLQTRRQQAVTAVPSQPVTLDTTAVTLPQKRRRSSSTRKAKQLRNGYEPVTPLTTFQLTSDSMTHVPHSRVLPIATTFATASSTTPAGIYPVSSAVEKSLSEELGGARHMINPYTGDLELVDVAEDDSLNMSVDSVAELLVSHSSQPVTAPAVSNSDHFVTVGGLSSHLLPSRATSATVKVSESVPCATGGNLLSTGENVSCQESATVSSSLVSRSERRVDWYTASQSDKHSHLPRDSAQLLYTSDSLGMKQAEVVEGIKVSAVTASSVDSIIGSSGMKAEAYRSDKATSAFSVTGQPLTISLPKPSTAVVSCLEPSKLKSCFNSIPLQSSNLSSSSMQQLSSSQADLIQMAFTLAKQNGSALHASSLVDNWTKNAGLLQSLHGMQSIALATTNIAFHSSSTATTTTSCAQSRAKDVDGVSSATTVASSDPCFFPAVSCFPPEHRRKSAVNVGGFGISPKPQLQTGSFGIVSSLVSSLPAVKVLRSTSVSLDEKASGTSDAASTVSNVVPLNSSVSTESNFSLSSGEGSQLTNTDVKKSIPLLTHLTPTTWPLMPNLLTVPLMSANPLSASPLLHCVTRASLTPDGKLTGLSAAVTHAKGSIVPIAGRFCIPMSCSQAALVTASTDRQNIESTVVAGIRPHAIMLNDNFAKFRLAVSSTPSKSSGKHSSSKDRRGSTTRMDDCTVQRGSGKSHLTVAQLLDMAKNARLQQTACDDEQVTSAEQHNAPSSSVVTSASLQPQPALTMSPPKNLRQLSSVPLQTSSVLLTSYNQSQAQLLSVQLSSSSHISSHTSLTASTQVQTSASPLLSLSSASQSIVLQPATTVVVSTLPSHLSAQPLNSVTSFTVVSTCSSAFPVEVPAKICTQSAHGSDCSSLNTFTPSVSAYLVHPPLPIMSPRYPLNLTESVKKAMRGVGLYPSPPVSPTTPLQTFGSAKLPEIRPYPVSIACSVPVSELSVKKLLHDRSTVSLPVTSRPMLATTLSCAAPLCVNSCSLLTSSVISTSQQASNKTVSSLASSTVCAETVEKQMTVSSCNVSSQSDSTGPLLVSSVTFAGSTSAADCILTCDSLFAVSHTSAVQPESTTINCSAYIRLAGSAVTVCEPNSRHQSGLVENNSSIQAHPVYSYNNLKDDLHNTKTVNCINGGLSASWGDSGMELNPDVLEVLFSVETDTGLTSPQSSPCSTELANVVGSTKDTDSTNADNYKVTNCLTPVDHHGAGSKNTSLLCDTHLCKESLSLNYNITSEDGCIKSELLASNVSVASADNRDNLDVATAAGLVHSTSDPSADSSVTSSDCTLLKRSKLDLDVSGVSVRSATRRKRPAEVDKTSGLNCHASNSMETVGCKRIPSVTRMTTRSSWRTTAANTELVNETDRNRTKTAMSKTLVKSLEKRERSSSESSNHSPDVDTTKSVAVAQRRSLRTPVAKVIDMKKSEAVTTCQDADSSMGLRSRRYAQKVNSVELVSPRKRSRLRGSSDGREDLFLVDSTEDVIGVCDNSSTGIEIHVNDHEDCR